MSMSSRRPILDEEAATESETVAHQLHTTEIPAATTTEARVQLSLIAKEVAHLTASYCTDLTILRRVPLNWRYVSRWTQDHFIGLDPLMGAVLSSGFRALDYTRIVNRPLTIALAIQKSVEELAYDIVYAELTGILYTTVNHCLFNREPEEEESAAWNVFGPYLMRNAKDCLVNAYKRGGFFRSGTMADGHVAEHYIVQGGHTVKPHGLTSSNAALNEPFLPGDTARKPLLMTVANPGGMTTDVPTTDNTQYSRISSR